MAKKYVTILIVFYKKGYEFIMKRIKSLLAIVLCIGLILSVFAGCSKKDSISGKWTATLNMTDSFTADLSNPVDERIDEFREQIEYPLNVKIICKIDRDNKYTLQVADEEELKNDLNEVLNLYIDNLLDAAGKYAESVGMTPEECDAKYKSENGRTMREALEADLELDAAVQNMLDKLTSSEPKQLVISHEALCTVDENGDLLSYATFTSDGKTMTVSRLYDKKGNELTAASSFPIEFKK